MSLTISALPWLVFEEQLTMARRDGVLARIGVQWIVVDDWTVPYPDMLHVLELDDLCAIVRTADNWWIAVVGTRFTIISLRNNELLSAVLDSLNVIVGVEPLVIPVDEFVERVFLDRIPRLTRRIRGHLAGRWRGSEVDESEDQGTWRLYEPAEQPAVRAAIAAGEPLPEAWRGARPFSWDRR